MTGAMTHRPANPGREMNLTRLAWLVSIATPVVLIGLLCLAKAASSHRAVRGHRNAGTGRRTDEVEEECFEWEEGVLECEDRRSEAEAKAARYPPEECLLRTARARVVSSPSRNRLRFIVRYTTVDPDAGLPRLPDAQGRADSLDLGVVKRHLGRSGVLRLTRDPRQRPDGAGPQTPATILLTLDIPSAPSYCQPYFTRRLALRRTVHGQTVWFQSDPAAGPVE